VQGVLAVDVRDQGVGVRDCAEGGYSLDGIEFIVVPQILPHLNESVMNGSPALPVLNVDISPILNEEVLEVERRVDVLGAVVDSVMQ